jgi:two-component system LytT family sensor kinase
LPARQCGPLGPVGYLAGVEFNLKVTLPDERKSAVLQATEESTASLSIPRGRYRTTTLFWILHCGGWLAFGVAMFAWGLDYFNPRDAFVNKALLVITGFVVTLILRSLYRGARARSRTPLASALLIFLLSFTGAAIWREIQNLLFQAYTSVAMSGNIAVRLVAIPLGTLLYDGFVLFAWSLLYYGVNDWVELARQRERATKAEARAHAARLRALQSQLEPHFLFNTLNAISTLVVEGQNLAAARMIARLSDFLRLTLDTTETPEISVAEELEFVLRYLEIEQVRFGDRLRVAIEVPPDAMQGLVPALVLQPLVENAVKHGVLPREQGGSVTVTVARNNGTLQICVADDGPGLPQGAAVARAVGISNTEARLAELYGDKSSFSLRPSPNGGVTAMMRIPFRTAPPRFDHDATQGKRG